MAIEINNDNYIKTSDDSEWIQIKKTVYDNLIGNLVEITGKLSNYDESKLIDYKQVIEALENRIDILEKQVFEAGSDSSDNQLLNNLNGKTCINSIHTCDEFRLSVAYALVHLYHGVATKQDIDVLSSIEIGDTRLSKPSGRFYNCCQRGGIKTLLQLVSNSTTNLKTLRNFGAFTLEEGVAYINDIIGCLPADDICNIDFDFPITKAPGYVDYAKLGISRNVKYMLEDNNLWCVNQIVDYLKEHPVKELSPNRSFEFDKLMSLQQIVSIYQREKSSGKWHYFNS